MVKNMSKYLTVCDLDDTLLTTKKKIRRKSIHFIKKYLQKGNYFVICTGRPFNGAISFYNMLPKGMPMITDNGGVIHYPTENGFKTISFDTPKEIMVEFLQQIDDSILSGCATVGNNHYIQNRAETPSWIIHNELESNIIEGQLKDILNENPILVNLWLKEGTIENFEKIANRYSEYFLYRNWGFYNDRYSIEIYPKDASKGNAMEYLAKEFKVDYTCAFGDQWNDLSMIMQADYGIAMINAVDRLKVAAKYQTEKDHNHNGVVHYLKKNKLY